MAGELGDLGVAQLVQPLGFLPGLFLNRVDGAVSFARDSLPELVVFSFELHLELSDAVIRSQLGRLDELFGFLPCGFEHCLQLDFRFEEVTELSRRLGAIVSAFVFPLRCHAELPAWKVPEAGRWVSSLKDFRWTK